MARPTMDYELFCDTLKKVWWIRQAASIDVSFACLMESGIPVNGVTGWLALSKVAEKIGAVKFEVIPSLQIVSFSR